MNSGRPLILAALLVALGVAGAGLFVGRGVIGSRTADRFVTVKGVAERDVMANVALWPLQVVTASNELGTAQRALDGQIRDILGFLARRGIDSTSAEIGGLEVTDRLANRYGGDQTQGGMRFVIQQQLIVRSEEPEKLLAASQDVGALVEAGVVISSGSGFGPAVPTFLFTRLNDVKPEMIAEATRSAREAAERFAADSGTRVGGIRQASQGVFVILPRDQAPGIQESTQLQKTLRVVCTIDYYLK
jgi:hypothetical protein